MIDRSNWNDEFLKSFMKPIIVPDTEAKIKVKHGIYFNEIVDGLGDPCLVARKASRNTSPKPGQSSRGRTYDIFCETSDGRILFITGRLFEDGNFLIYTAMPEWKLDEDDLYYYHNEREVVCSE